jgi:pimeloyl-ACP methyl ester carboxylesterase
METPSTNFLEHDGVSIAWQVFGEGPAEVLFIPGWVSNVDQFWQYPEPRAFFEALGAFARVAVYDKPGTGASDPVEATPSIEQRIDQLVAVMDAAGLDRPTVIATSEGGVTGCLVAAARPSRVERLILLNATAGGFDRRAHGDMTDAEFGDWLAFIHKDTDEAARLCQRQRLTQQLHSLVLFAMRVQGDRL